MLHMLAKDGFVAMKWEAEDRWRWSQRKSFQNLLHSRILERDRDMAFNNKLGRTQYRAVLDASTLFEHHYSGHDLDLW